MIKTRRKLIPKRPRVVVSVSGGVAEIEHNPENLGVLIIDLDNGESPVDVVVIVEGGVAYEWQSSDVNLEIVDYDNEED